MKSTKYILASASPRRKDLLSLYIKDFEIIPANIDEYINPNLPVQAEIERIASEKAATVQAGEGDVVIAADTVVLKDNVVYGKPRDAADARCILMNLRGAAHVVITSVAIAAYKKQIAFSDTTEVLFNDYSDEIIDWYVARGECFDRAGAYAIQGLGSVLVHSINGDYNTVVGLPIAKLMLTLCNEGLYSFNA